MINIKVLISTAVHEIKSLNCAIKNWTLNLEISIQLFWAGAVPHFHRDKRFTLGTPHLRESSRNSLSVDVKMEYPSNYSYKFEINWGIMCSPLGQKKPFFLKLNKCLSNPLGFTRKCIATETKKTGLFLKLIKLFFLFLNVIKQRIKKIS